MHLVKYDDGDSKWHDLLLEETVGTIALMNPPKRMMVDYDDSAPHFIVYNADTRVLNMYPNMTVLEEADVRNPAKFVQHLAGPPYYLYVPPNAEWVRQVFVRVAAPRCTEVPHVCSRALQQHASEN